MRVKLKSFKHLKKNGHIQHQYSGDGRYMIASGEGSWKMFDSDSFDNEFTVAETNKVISKEEYEEFKHLFVKVKGDSMTKEKMDLNEVLPEDTKKFKRPEEIEAEAKAKKEK